MPCIDEINGCHHLREGQSLSIRELDNTHVGHELAMALLSAYNYHEYKTSAEGCEPPG